MIKVLLPILGQMAILVFGIKKNQGNESRSVSINNRMLVKSSNEDASNSSSSEGSFGDYSVMTSHRAPSPFDPPVYKYAFSLEALKQTNRTSSQIQVPNSGSINSNNGFFNRLSAGST